MELTEAGMDEEGEPVNVGAPAGVRFENLVFRYQDGETDVIKDFNADFLPGSRTAVIGETGAGKSTLLRLILALLKPVSGRVTIYGPDGRGYEASPRTRINLVYVPQGNSLFSGSIRENLLIGDPKASESRMWQALDVAAAGFVRELPQGLDTPCSEGGSGLSEGQAQRIAIARGLLRPGSIMLFDEFSSSLDEQTEQLLMENLAGKDGFAAGKTMIFITHLMKLADYCDNIVEI